MYIRKTYDEYNVLVDCGFGFEHETTELTWKEARLRRKEYYENVPSCSVKIVKKRVRK